MKINEMREALINSGVKEEDLKSLKKAELEELYKTTIPLETVVVTQEVNLMPSEPGEIKDTPKITDPEWTDYVMGLMTDKEKEGDNPKVDGLRRVATLLLGDFSTKTDVLQVPSIENSNRATVVVTVTFGRTSTSGAADVFGGNTARDYAVHAVATAETRAEGRALRKALKLTKVLTAEEMSKAEKDEANGTDSRIQSGMLNGLKLMADKLGVDVQKVALKQGYEVNTPEDLTSTQGLAIANVLGQYNREKETIPPEVKR